MTTPNRQRRPSFLRPPLGLAAAAALTAVAIPVWVVIAGVLGSGWTAYEWNATCYGGEPSFAVGQGALAALGTLAGGRAVLTTFRWSSASLAARRRVYMFFAVAVVAFVGWVLVLGLDPERHVVSGAECHLAS
jgi:hypothetical protein